MYPMYHHRSHAMKYWILFRRKKYIQLNQLQTWVVLKNLSSSITQHCLSKQKLTTRRKRTQIERYAASLLLTSHNRFELTAVVILTILCSYIAFLGKFQRNFVQLQARNKTYPGKKVNQRKTTQSWKLCQQRRNSQQLIFSEKVYKDDAVFEE